MEKAATPAEAPQRPPIMPANVRAGQVIGLVEITGGLGTPIDASKLADEFGSDLAVLLPILDTGEMLGLIKVEKGDVSLTELGQKFQRLSKNKVRMLKDQLAKVEPFKTALELATRDGEFSASDVANALQEKDIRWHHKQEMNEMQIQALLIHWSIYAGLLNYNGKDGKFRKA
ncbi:MAG: AAA-associated domain-containing protein [Nitrososphaerota archaeon]|nr:AAA-associated domain-containing protein [Nitrososphaerota archaeon]